MASGILCSLRLPSVALPSFKALYAFVKLTNPLNGKRAFAAVLDVGPHYTDDDEYVFEGARPKAESTRPNKAGIDLSEAIWAALGMTDNTDVDWEFIVPQ